MKSYYGSISEYEDTFYYEDIPVFTPIEAEERTLFINCIKIAEGEFGKLTLRQVNRVAHLVTVRDR